MDNKPKNNAEQPKAVAAAPALSPEEIAEFNRLKAEDAERQRQAIEAAKTPKKTLAEQMNDDYINNRGTIQTIARHYKVEVDEVLRAIGQPEMASVHTIGDLVDTNELGPTDAPVSPEGQVAKVPFSLN